MGMEKKEVRRSCRGSGFVCSLQEGRKIHMGHMDMKREYV